MDEPRPKWRITIGALLVVMLGVCVGFALIRASLVGWDEFVLVAVVVLVGGTLAALIGILSGRKPVEGLVWGLLLVITVGAVVWFALPGFQY